MGNTKQGIRQVVRRIVEAKFPDQLEVFDFECEEAIERIEKQGHLEDDDDVEAVSGFGVPVSDLLAWASVLLGVYSVVKDHRKQTISSDKLESEWEERLTSQGIESDLAKEIAAQFIQDIRSLL